MKARRLAPFAAFVLLGFTAACSERETATAELGESESLPVVIEQVRSGPIDRGSTTTGSGDDVFARFEHCELNDTTEARMRELVERLDALQVRYTEQHPEMIATRRLLDELEQAALSDCVERLQ